MTLIIGTALIVISVICAMCILANALWKGFEEFAARKLAEDAGRDVADGDYPRISDLFQHPERF